MGKTGGKIAFFSLFFCLIILSFPISIVIVGWLQYGVTVSFLLRDSLIFRNIGIFISKSGDFYVISGVFEVFA